MEFFQSSAAIGTFNPEFATTTSYSSRPRADSWTGPLNRSPSSFNPPNPPNRNRNFRQPPPRRPRSPKPPKAKKMESNCYFCQPCNLYMNGVQQITSHMSGKKHQASVDKTYQSPSAPSSRPPLLPTSPSPLLPSSRPPPPPPLPLFPSYRSPFLPPPLSQEKSTGTLPAHQPSRAAAAAARGRKDNSSDSAFPKKSKEVGEIVKEIMDGFQSFPGQPLIGLQYASVKVESGGDHGVIECSLCHCSLDSRSASNLSHFIGLKHRLAFIYQHAGSDEVARLQAMSKDSPEYKERIRNVAGTLEQTMGSGIRDIQIIAATEKSNQQAAKNAKRPLPAGGGALWPNTKKRHQKEISVTVLDELAAILNFEASNMIVNEEEARHALQVVNHVSQALLSYRSRGSRL
eukprot:m.25370 g.25370  ORF g.25370 m.25370 type:complete len:402 (+) comp28795_c0_seq1:6041-7246(+)